MVAALAVSIALRDALEQCRTSHSPASHDLRLCVHPPACGSNVIQGSIAVAGMNVHGAHRVERNDRGEALAACCKRCGPDAVIGGNACDLSDAARLKQTGEAGAVESGVLLKCWGGALAHNDVRDGVDGLPSSQRVAMTLKFASDMKVADIGAVMGRSEGAIKLLLHRGMIGVRCRLHVRPRVSSYSLR